jgi:hypothetical protein
LGITKKAQATKAMINKWDDRTKNMHHEGNNQKNVKATSVVGH